MSETWFDREVCTCGVMHDRYVCCGVPADYCASHGHDDGPRDSDDYEAGRTDSMLRAYQIGRILDDLIAELRAVTWPTAKTTANHALARAEARLKGLSNE